MSLNLATLNASELRDPSNCAHLLGELSKLMLNVAAVQDSHFTCAADCRVLEWDLVVLSAFGSRSSAGVYLLFGRSLDANVNVVFAGDGGWLGDFTRLQEAEAAHYEGIITKCEVRDALKQVGLNKSSGLDGLPYEVFLRLPHMFVPILTDVFNHWFAQGAIPGSVPRAGSHCWREAASMFERD